MDISTVVLPDQPCPLTEKLVVAGVSVRFCDPVCVKVNGTGYWVCCPVVGPGLMSRLSVKLPNGPLGNVVTVAV